MKNGASASTPAPPAAPLGRYISMASEDHCPDCQSTMMGRRFFFFGASPGCIHPKCKNYGARIK